MLIPNHVASLRRDLSDANRILRTLRAEFKAAELAFYRAQWDMKKSAAAGKAREAYRMQIEAVDYLERQEAQAVDAWLNGELVA